MATDSRAEGGPSPKRARGGERGGAALVWGQVARRLNPHDHIAFSLACKTFRQACRDSREGGSLTTDLRLLPHEREGGTPSFSLDWFKWVYETFERREGARPDDGGDEVLMHTHTHENTPSNKHSL